MKVAVVLVCFCAMGAVDGPSLWRRRLWKEMAVYSLLWLLGLHSLLAVALQWPQVSLNRLVAGIVTSMTGGSW